MSEPDCSDDGWNSEVVIRQEQATDDMFAYIDELYLKHKDATRSGDQDNIAFLEAKIKEAITLQRRLYASFGVEVFEHCAAELHALKKYFRRDA
ncbi:hypothetical protein Rvan_1869 [Rhodomicrobium vannielii ATCC 17100]|uniref:Uncharacterized protein n=1 Tax=Rhodomicrobium vannielii (strain ATCC 17100 / DSM 162 / LMG 4299 / NCIMB 10020 / ATH 3.1.1) TaxID=648757 RepID=E3I075_RHOVT|nr:hypothetical protein [Rhodomicrobium vannielii]ADP71110.1 hypothetical protein Rvan_1869 [Rhodomicrobium vannielii ATCC 17100]